MIAGNSIKNFAGEVLGSLEFQQTLPREFLEIHVLKADFLQVFI